MINTHVAIMYIVFKLQPTDSNMHFKYTPYPHRSTLYLFLTQVQWFNTQLCAQGLLLVFWLVCWLVYDFAIKVGQSLFGRQEGNMYA